jgi:ADP-ribose pyrophosphatase YjhB (NUDIX family)
MDNSRFELPGGVLEEAEAIEAGVVREVLEETGVTVTCGRLTGVYKNLSAGVVALVFRCYMQSGEPHATDEAKQSLWMSREEVLNSMPPAFSCRLLDAVQLDGPQVRNHDGVNLLD